MSYSCDPMDCRPPGSSVHGILQARILEWVAISFSRRSSQPKNQMWVSCTAGRFFTNWAMRDAHIFFFFFWYNQTQIWKLNEETGKKLREKLRTEILKTRTSENKLKKSNLRGKGTYPALSTRCVLENA